MIYIAHRGLFKGPDEKLENHPSQIKRALEEGFNVEIDVWFIDGKFILGHDKPQYEVSNCIFDDYRIWAHAKNIEALKELLYHPFADVFFHDQDDATLTFHNYIWTYPKGSIQLTNRSIAVMPERVGEWEGLKDCAGLCSDYVEQYKKDINFKIAVQQ